ncbi:MAG: TolC family protein [Arenicellaceae bacterium]|jgi:outer membrane protein TolC|nr:TolC family protein [Arenicellaceae bacterium]
MIARVTRAMVCGIYIACTAAIAFVVAGCTTVGPSNSKTLGVSKIAIAISPEQLKRIERRTLRETELLSQPQTAESAAELALLHHPAVERMLEDLDMPGFDRLQLAHTVNPAFNGGVRPSTVDTRIERSISVNLMTWVSVSALASESAELRSRRVQAADELVAMLFVARRSWVYAIAARQSVFYLADVAAAAEAGRDIMENMRQIGNSTELEFLRAQAVYADTVANLTAAQAAAAIERERLVQAMGLWGEEADRVQLPQRLPDLPITAVGPEGLEARAVSQRFDVRVGRLEGSAGEAGVNARADVRSAWLAYRGEYDLAKHAQEAIVPLARRVSEEQLKLYNGMLVGVMDLISDATERTNAVSAALNSQRNFWLAEIELQRAMSGVGVSAVAPPNGTNTLSSEVVSHAD